MATAISPHAQSGDIAPSIALPQLPNVIFPSLPPASHHQRDRRCHFGLISLRFHLRYELQSAAFADRTRSFR